MSPENDEAARLKTVHNERIKLAATYMNGIAIATVAVGGLAPIAQNHFEAMSGAQIAVSLVKLALCLAASGGLHLGASFLLRSLK